MLANAMNIFEGGVDIHALVMAADANSDVTGARVNLKNYERCYLLLQKHGAEDVDDLALEVFQANAASGGTTKALNISRCWHKTHASVMPAQWTQVDIATPNNMLGFGAAVPSGGTRVVADVNTGKLDLLVEIRADQLDGQNGFTWVFPFIEGDNADNACLVSVQAILVGNNYAQAIPLSPIAA